MYCLTMRHVLDAIDQWRDRIERNPLHGWLTSRSSADGAVETRLWFALYFVNFIMYFREMNRYHISYESPVSPSPPPEFERVAEAISEHAREDMTHAHLFMRDFESLGWDELLDWKPSEVLHWLFTSDLTESLRRRTVTIARLCIEAEDPIQRYAVIEAIEACGHALFRRTAELAAEYTNKTNTRLIYWGDHHLAKETGHVADDGEVDGLLDVRLTKEERGSAIWRATRIFELIDEQNSDMLRLAQETLSQGGFAYRAERYNRPNMRIETHEGPEVFDFHFWPGTPDPSQRPILETLRACTDEVTESGLLDYFDDVPDVATAMRRLRRVLLYTATDTTSTPTVYRHMLPYSIPTTAEERALNRLARRFGRRAPLLYIDWHRLGMDDLLGWPMSRMLRFVYLDADTESHRQLRAIITHHIDRTTDPVLRYWTIVALKSMTALYAEPIARLATRVEAETGLHLPYLSLKLLTDGIEMDPDPEADAVRFEGLEVSQAVAQQAVDLIGQIHRAVQRRMAEMIASDGEADYAEVA